MVSSLVGRAPFQIAFVVRDLERTARAFDARLAAGLGVDGSSARKDRAASTAALRPSGRFVQR
jgi:hypothetical protein